MKSYNHITQKEWEEIDAYLNNAMTEAEEQIFEQKIADSPLLHEKIREVKLTHIGIEKASLSEKLKEIDLQKGQLHTVSRSRQKRRKWTPLLALAAAFVGILFLITQKTSLFQGKNEKLFTDFYKPDPGLLTAMGETDNYAFEVAMVAYKAEKYEEAIQKWKPLLTLRPENDTLNYFMGNSLLALKKPKEAETHYRKVLNLPESAFYEEAKWYLGLTLIKLKRTDEAIPLIEQSNHKNKKDVLQQIE